MINGTTSYERRLYIGSIAPEASVLAHAVRAHWSVENQVYWCLDVATAEYSLPHLTPTVPHSWASGPFDAIAL